MSNSSLVYVHGWREGCTSSGDGDQVGRDGDGLGGEICGCPVVMSLSRHLSPGREDP
jgi:hypothetical protein